MNFKVFGFFLLISGLVIVGFSGIKVLGAMPTVMERIEFQEKYNKWREEARRKKQRSKWAYVAKWSHPGGYNKYVKKQKKVRSAIGRCFYDKFGATGDFFTVYRACPIMGFSVVVTYFGLGLALLGLFMFLSAKRSREI